MDRGHSKGPSLDRQITVQDVECLREAFALFDADRREEITVPELGKVSRDGFSWKLLVIWPRELPKIAFPLSLSVTL